MVKSEIKFEQIRKAAKRLPMKQRIRLVEELQRDTWQKRFKQMLSRIDARRKKYPISQKEINEVVAEARREYYAKRRR